MMNFDDNKRICKFLCSKKSNSRQNLNQCAASVKLISKSSDNLEYTRDLVWKLQTFYELYGWLMFNMQLHATLYDNIIDVNKNVGCTKLVRQNFSNKISCKIFNDWKGIKKSKYGNGISSQILRLLDETIFYSLLLVLAIDVRIAFGRQRMEWQIWKNINGNAYAEASFSLPMSYEIRILENVTRSGLCGYKILWLIAVQQSNGVN